MVRPRIPYVQISSYDVYTVASLYGYWHHGMWPSLMEEFRKCLSLCNPQLSETYRSFWKSTESKKNKLTFEDDSDI